MEYIIVLVILGAIALFGVLSYNNLIKQRNRVEEAWADIDVQLKRRYNLIPNLVETVKGYASHEKETFTKVTEARNLAVDAKDVKSQGMAENMLSGALKSLFAVSESYPDLKANQNFIQLQGELVDTEDKIQASRRFYNAMVRDYNTKIQGVPVNIIANMFGFKTREFFEIEDEAQRENVNVSFKKEEKAPASEKPKESDKESKKEAPESKKEEKEVGKKPKESESKKEEGKDESEAKDKSENKAEEKSTDSEKEEEEKDGKK